MEFKVQIDDFDGPLDLMLFLVRENKLDLFDLNIVELADQYIAFIQNAADQKLEVATEYLSELAGLIEFKSKRLLPRDKSELDAKDYDEEEENLVRRLIEYQRYKEVSLDLEERYELRMKQHARPIEISLFQEIEKKLNQTIEYDQNPYDLMKAMQKVLERFKIANPQDVSIEQVELSVEDVIDDVRRTFQSVNYLTLETLLLDAQSIQHLIVRFLAVLDLLRMNELVMKKEGEQVYLKGV